MDKNDVPLGFGFALAQAPDAMRSFSLLSSAEQEALLKKAHSVSSKEEMQSLIEGLTPKS